jgi:hypothetical protein
VTMPQPAKQNTNQKAKKGLGLKD